MNEVKHNYYRKQMISLVMEIGLASTVLSANAIVNAWVDKQSKDDLVLDFHMQNYDSVDTLRKVSSKYCLGDFKKFEEYVENQQSIPYALYRDKMKQPILTSAARESLFKKFTYDMMHEAILSGCFELSEVLFKREYIDYLFDYKILTLIKGLYSEANIMWVLEQSMDTIGHVKGIGPQRRDIILEDLGRLLKTEWKKPFNHSISILGNIESKTAYAALVCAIERANLTNDEEYIEE